MLKKLGLLCTAAAVALGASPALAEYPERPITLIIGFGVGGNSDVGGRTVAAHLAPCLGPNATIIPQNMTGANGEIAFNAIATGAPDGYQIGIVAYPRGVITPIVKKVPWNKDTFYSFGSLVAASSTLVVSKSSPWNTLDDIIAASKERPNGLNVGTSGVGSEDHLMLLQLARLTGIKFNFIPFDSDASGFTAVMGGHIDMVAAASPTVARYREDVKPIFVAAEQRQPELLPAETPTLRELGFDIIAGSTHVVSGPLGLPDEVKTKIAGCVEKLGKDEAFLADAKKRSLLILPKNAEQIKVFLDNMHNTIYQLWQTDPWDPN